MSEDDSPPCYNAIRTVEEGSSSSSQHTHALKYGTISVVVSLELHEIGTVTDGIRSRFGRCIGSAHEVVDIGLDVSWAEIKTQLRDRVLAQFILVDERKGRSAASSSSPRTAKESGWWMRAAGKPANGGSSNMRMMRL